MHPYLQRLILEGEHQQLDFKVEISDPGKIARSIVAFSNTGGGRLLIGVKDGGGIAGVRTEEEIYMLKVAVRKFCKPRITYETRMWEAGRKQVLEVILPQGELKPYYCLDEGQKWKAYIRIGDQNILANRILLKVWERKKAGSNTLLRYNLTEDFLLKYLEENTSISLHEFIGLARVPAYLAEKVLVNLVSMDLLDMEIGEKAIRFRLNRQQFES